MTHFKNSLPVALIILFCHILCNQAFATDLEHSVLGSEVEDTLGSKKDLEASPYIINNSDDEVDKIKIKESAEPDYLFKKNNEISHKLDPKNKYKGFGYTLPGTFESEDNYLEIDKKSMVHEFRKQSSGALGIAFIQNNYNYESQDDTINRTISEGYKHVKGGALFVRSDQYFYRTDVLNSFWSIGAGVGYNSGKGIFINGERSETTFRLWEVPVDLGFGLEIPFYNWFKISGSLGPSVSVLLQNRSDIEPGEKGRNKTQVSYGQFLNTQFKINLSGFSDNTAYTLFTESRITNLFLNLELRYQNYQNYQDQIKISGTSMGIGFTFEYL